MNTKIRSFLAFGALALSSGWLPAQDEKPAPQPTVPQLIEQLGARDYQSRRAAETSLRALGNEALDALRKAAADDKDAEVQWRARRLVGQIEAGTDGRLRRRDPAGTDSPPDLGRGRGAPNGNDLERMFGDMFEHLERDLGVDVPRGRFFQDDFFKSLQQQMQEVQRGGANLPGAGQAFSLRVGPDGVRVEVTEKDQDGKESSKVYEAPDMKAFREKYPQIADRYLQGPNGGRTFGFGGRFPGGLQMLSPRMTVPDIDNVPDLPMRDAAIVDNGERLGVMVQAVPDAVREFLRLEPGLGLSVQGVDQGSLAQTLGVLDGDVLLEVDGKPIGAPMDVRDALAGVGAGAKVTVKVNRRGEEKELEATKPAAPKTGAKRLEKREPAKIR